MKSQRTNIAIVENIGTKNLPGPIIDMKTIILNMKSDPERVIVHIMTIAIKMRIVVVRKITADTDIAQDRTLVNDLVKFVITKKRNEEKDKIIRLVPMTLHLSLNILSHFKGFFLSIMSQKHHEIIAYGERIQLSQTSYHYDRIEDQIGDLRCSEPKTKTCSLLYLSTNRCYSMNTRAQ